MISTAELCDSGCPATATVTVQLPSGNTLRFCGHHYNDQADRLVLAGASVTGIATDNGGVFVLGGARMEG